MILKELDKFFHRFKRYFFKYKNGFYELPYLANSPESMIESFKHVPFLNWNEDKKLMTTKNPFVNGSFFWHKIEDGFWFVLADLQYKNNVSYKFVYDKFLPANYYLLSFNIITHNASIKTAVINGLNYKTLSWNVIKPKAGAFNSNFKGTDCSSVCIYFSEEWAKENLLNNVDFNKSKFHSFIESKKSSIILWPDLDPESVEFINTAQTILAKTNEKEKLSGLKKFAASFLNNFIEKYDVDHSLDDVSDLKNETQLILLKIEKVLESSLFKDFPGIEFLADKFSISPTKLKAGFKQLYGESIYQYYLGKQMDYAKILIAEKNMKVGAVSHLLGYKNDSKFSEAFKNKHGVLPSKIEVSL